MHPITCCSVPNPLAPVGAPNMSMAVASAEDWALSLLSSSTKLAKGSSSVAADSVGTGVACSGASTCEPTATVNAHTHARTHARMHAHTHTHAPCSVLAEAHRMQQTRSPGSLMGCWMTGSQCEAECWTPGEGHQGALGYTQGTRKPDENWLWWLCPSFLPHPHTARPTPTSALPSALRPAAAAAVTAELAASQRPVEVRAKVKTFTGVDLLGRWTQHHGHLPHL